MANLIVQSAVKDQLTDHNVAADFYDALDEEVNQVLQNAAQHAQDNDRKTGPSPRSLTVTETAGSRYVHHSYSHV